MRWRKATTGGILPGSRGWNSALPLLLDAKPEVAMLKMEAVNDILKKLPGMDCGACGAPNCRALAEDIVQDQADQMDCIFVFRERVTSLAEDMIKISRKLPISLPSEEEEEEPEEE